jgi:hypothetical protein
MLKRSASLIRGHRLPHRGAGGQVRSWRTTVIAEAGPSHEVDTSPRPRCQRTPFISRFLQETTKPHPRPRWPASPTPAAEGKRHCGPRRFRWHRPPYRGISAGASARTSSWRTIRCSLSLFNASVPGREKLQGWTPE